MTVADRIKNEVEIAAITRSAKGSVIVNQRVKIFVEAEKVEDVVDTTGAGDAFNGAFAAALAAGLPLMDAAFRANRVAALKVERRGAALAMPRAAEVDARFRH